MPEGEVFVTDAQNIVLTSNVETFGMLKECVMHVDEFFESDDFIGRFSDAISGSGDRLNQPSQVRAIPWRVP
jgi:hypothetical protein